MKIACCVLDDTLYLRLAAVLQEAGFECARYRSDPSTWRALRHGNCNVILIDMDAKASERERILSWLNCRLGEEIPVVLLARNKSAEHIVFALDAGAEDVIALPFHAAELVARINAILRRVNRGSSRNHVELGGFVLERATGKLIDRGTAVELTHREFAMAWLFFSKPGIYISRETISISIWGVNSEIAGRTIEQHIYKLRKKLRLGPERGLIIRTAYTQGYRLEVSTAGAGSAHEQGSDATARPVQV